MNTLRIGDHVYPLAEVLLYLDASHRAEGWLEFSLYADCQDLEQAGFAINCMTIPGAKRLSHTVFELGKRSADTTNELAESVICEPGATLELAFLRIAFGAVHGDLMEVTLEAICQKVREEEEIPVLGILSARIVKRQSEPSFTPQLTLPL